MKKYFIRDTSVSLLSTVILAACNTNIGTSSNDKNVNSLELIAPKTIYSKPDVVGSAYVVVNNPTAVNYNHLEYSLSNLIGGANGASIESTSAKNCALVAAYSQCNIKLTILDRAIAGSLKLNIINNDNSINKINAPGISSTIGVEQAAYNSLNGADGITLSYYHTVISGTPYVLISGLVASDRAGSFNKIILVDGNGVELPNQILIGDISNKQGSTFNILLPVSSVSNTSQVIKLQTQQVINGNVAIESTATTSTTLTTKENIGIAELLPSIVYLTESYPDQTVTIANIGDTLVELQQVVSGNENIEVVFTPSSLASGATTTMLFRLKDKTISPTTGNITLNYNNGQEQTSTSGIVDQNINPALTPTPAPAPTPTPAPYSTPSVTISNITGNTPASVMGTVPITFTATISGETSGEVSTVSAALADSVTGTIISDPSPCTLTIDGAVTSCNFTIIPWYVGFDNSTVSLTGYNPYTPANTVINLSASSGASIYGVINNQIDYSITTPYVYLQAVMPGNTATAGAGVTYGSGGTVNPRFVDGSQNGGGTCAGSKKDNLTNVEWLTNANEICSPTMCTWSSTAAAGSAQAAAAAFNAGGGKCGYTDWRLPTERELQTLFNYSAVDGDQVVWLASQGFTGSNNGNPQGTGYWSATVSPPNSALNVFFNTSTYTPRFPQSTARNVWLVRGNNTKVAKDAPGDTSIAGIGKEWPATRFIVDASGNCMIDQLTGLVWPKNFNIAGEGTWGDSSTPGTAQYAISQMNTNVNATTYKLCGYTDWRLPTLNEMFSMMNYGLTTNPYDSYAWLGTMGFTGGSSTGTPDSTAYFTSTLNYYGTDGYYSIAFNGSPRSFPIVNGVGSNIFNIVPVRGGE